MELVMGDNAAAQIHASNSLRDCISSHWSTDSLDGAMRYVLAGRHQSNSENIIGSDFCRTRGQGYSPISGLSQEVRDAVRVWTGSPGHFKTMTNPRHRKVNVGLAWDRYNFFAVTQFEGDFIEFTLVPTIQNGNLSMEGYLKNGANLEHGDHTRVIVSYSPPPQELTRGQIASVYGACLGRKVASLSYTSSGEVDSKWTTCLSPYDFPPDSPAPSSAIEARRFWQEAQARRKANTKTVPITTQRIKMSEFRLEGHEFTIIADLRAVLETHGPGVYHVDIFGVLAGGVVLISEYRVFHDIPAPKGYGQD